MRIQTIIAFLCCLLGIACAKEDGVCLKSIGKESTKEISLENFKHLEINHKIDVELYHSSSPKAQIFTGENIIDGISLKVENNTLKIDNYNRCNWLRNLKQKPLVKLYVDSLESLTFYGAGNLVAKDTILSKIFVLEAWEGSGDIDFTVKCSDLYLKANTGVVNFNIKGKSDYLYIYNNTYSFFNTENLLTNEAYLVSQGNGDIKVFAQNKLSVEQRSNNIIEYNASVNQLNILQQTNGQLKPY